MEHRTQDLSSAAQSFGRLPRAEREDDADNPVEIAFGNEANPEDIEQFERRFGCTVMDSYGSSEGAAVIVRTPGTPRAALGPVTGSAADAQALDAHLRKQPELGTKWLPRFLRITSSMPTTATDLQPLTAADLAAIREEFGRHGRTRALTLLV